MPWTKDNYPDSMKNLDPRVRNKAIEIANALVGKKEMDDGRAISIAIKQARDWAESN